MTNNFFQRKNLLRFCVLPALCATHLACAADNADWRWIRVGMIDQGWNVVEGHAKVTISGQGFTALLYDKEHPTFLRFSIEGKINGKAISASEVRAHSDVDSIKLVGLVDKFDCDDKDNNCRMLFSLGDGFNYVAISSFQNNR